MIINNTTPNLTMGQKLKMFREFNNLSQEQLGQKLNVTDKTISAWETGEREININNAKTICKLFNISNSYFVFDENFNTLDEPLKKKIKEYYSNLDFMNKLDIIISKCKSKLENDGITVKKEYLPIFDFDKNNFLSYGLFDENDLPIKVTKHTSGRDIGRITYTTDIDNKNIENPPKYTYSSEQLTKFGLYDILNRFNIDKVELKDLINCNNIEIFKDTLRNMRKRKFIKRQHSIVLPEIDITNEYIQDQLNEVLENLCPDLSKFWEIIVFLIDNGAYYSKEIACGSQIAPDFKNIKDISKTNIIYRIAKDKISK